ncbi:MAG: putative DNA modification/repair radical SAM protein [Atopobiaceae bacterium]
MDTLTKLGILAEAARFDAACTSSGVQRSAVPDMLGVASRGGICHSFTADGRCITLLKVLMSNACSYDCAYCVNRRSASCPRATFSPRELAELTVDFYKRNYIEGLFLSSGVLGTPDNTTEHMIECLRILRQELRFNGYVHAKVIPQTSPELVDQLGRLADRLSVNLELPSAHSLQLLCPDKDAKGITHPMAQIARTRSQEEHLLKEARAKRRKGRTTLHAGSEVSPGGPAHPSSVAGSSSQGILPSGAAPIEATGTGAGAHGLSRRFAPAGQSTQLIIGATPEDDNHILKLSKSLYRTYGMKRVFFSAYVPMMDDQRLPSSETPVPLRREHRLYQADWLMRFYSFDADELVSPEAPWLDLELDPKMAWALSHLDQFPVEIMDAPRKTLLRVPGIGPAGARKIISARKTGTLTMEDLVRMRIVVSRARYFITCNGRRDPGAPLDYELIRGRMVADAQSTAYNRRQNANSSQLSLF